MNAVGLCAAATAGTLIILLPRKQAIIAVIAIAAYIPFEQKLIVTGLHFTMLRLVVLFGWIRILGRKEWQALRWNTLDKVFLCWSTVGTVAYCALWHTGSALVYRLGYQYDALGLYLLARVLASNVRDVARIAKVTAFMLAPLALCMLVERATGRNPFSALGGVTFSAIRAGSVRAQGPFQHAILAGTFGAAWLPIFLSLWRMRQFRTAAIVGVCASTAITLSSGSSGPVMTYLAGALGIVLYQFKEHMRVLRWSFVCGLIILQLLMKAPVWFLLARINVLAASDGWHRANLIDQTVTHVGDWFLIGTKDVTAWGVWAGDITSQYIFEAVNGGALTLALFISLFPVAFSFVGKAASGPSRLPLPEAVVAWAVGSAIAAQAATFVSVSYFDQNILNWYFLLAFASAVYQSGFKHRREMRAIRRKTSCDEFSRRQEHSGVTISS